MSPLDSVFKNEHLIVVDKPALTLTTPARDAADPRPCLGRELQAALGQQIYPVHRLDFEVSGLVIFALTADAHRRAQRWFEEGSVLKTYRARTLARPAGFPEEWTEWRSRLVRGKRRTFKAPHGKESRTRARVIAAHAEALDWDVMPLTGRPHQLRVELSDHGWPILGDVLYGGAPGGEGIALRAWRLDFSGVGERLGLPEVIEITPETKIPREARD